jgi:Protein of unknown function (DUF2889)
MSTMGNELMAAEPDLEELHTRDYQVRAYRKTESTILLRGAVRDVKPAGMYLEGDTEPLEIHHMIVDITVSLPALEIVDAHVVFETHPHAACPSIADHYGKLVGLSIARGFTHKVRELFGGPRGCTHTTALLQAMAPVAVQSIWSMRMAGADEQSVALGRSMTAEERMQAVSFNVNTCHVWAEDGAQLSKIARGEAPDLPLWAEARLTKLGRTPDEWRSQMRG